MIRIPTYDPGSSPAGTAFACCLVTLHIAPLSGVCKLDGWLAADM